MVSHLLPNRASIATLRCLHLVPSHIRTDQFWHPSQHIHNAVLLLVGFGSLLSRNTLSARTFPWTLGTTSIQDYDTLKTRFPTQSLHISRQTLTKTPKCAPTIQESDSRVKCVLTFKTHEDWLLSRWQFPQTVFSRVGGNGLAPWGFGLLLN